MSLFVISQCKVLKVAPTLAQAEVWADLLSPVHNFYINEVKPSSFKVYNDTELRKILIMAGMEKYSKGNREALEGGMFLLTSRMEVDHTELSELQVQLKRKPVPAPQPRTAEVSTPKAKPPATSAPASGKRMSSKQPEQNGIKLPKEGSKISAYWGVFQAYFERTNNVPSKVEVTADVDAAGLDSVKSTMSCQLRAWKLYHGL